MEYRELGKTGEKLSIVGMGGIVVKGMPQTEANAAVAEAIDRGVNYFDVAPTYGDAEEVLGRALEGKRDRIFLACKTTERTREGAARELATTLSRLRTDHVDLYQMHGLDDPKELAMALGPGGAMETFEAAWAEGKVRYVGITGHRVENLSEAIRTGRFNTVLFPVNFSQWEMAHYGPELLELARSIGVGRLAIKGAAKGPWAQDEKWAFPNCWYKPLADKRAFQLALRYTLSQDITAALPPGDLGLFKMAVDLAEDFQAISDSEVQELRSMSEQLTPLFAAK